MRLIKYLTCIVVATRAPYEKPIPIAICNIDPLSDPPAELMIIVLTNTRMVVARNSAMHPRTVLKKIFGVQNGNLIRFDVVINWRDSNGVLSYTDVESNIATCRRRP